MSQFLLQFSGGFLYFPEDKSAYIPAAIEFILLLCIVFATYKWFKRVARRQEEKARSLEARALQERDERLSKELNQK